AFKHYTHGKAAGRRMRPYAFARDETMFDALIRAFPAADAETATGDPTREPIFIIGLPRTGTTLLDRILSSHPDVCSTGELRTFPPCCSGPPAVPPRCWAKRTSPPAPAMSTGSSWARPISPARDRPR